MELYTRTDGSSHEILLEDFTYYNITVPKGFRTDGASAPRIFWAVIPPFKGTKKAAVVHDYLCALSKDKFERRAADGIFYKILRESGISLSRSVIGYLGVRFGAFVGAGVKYSHWLKDLKGLKWLLCKRL